MNVLRVKAGVRFDVIRPAGFRILSALDQAAQVCSVDLEISSGTDSHTAPDPHALGEAYDVSVKALTGSQIVEVRRTVTMMLGPAFTVLYEVPFLPTDPALQAIAYINREATGPHVHIQRKRGTIFPPVTLTPGTVVA